MHKLLTQAFEMPPEFGIAPVDPVVNERLTQTIPLPAPLGALVAFNGTFSGQGFNTIFRPDSAVSPTPMPGPVNTTDPADNVLELNLTDETLSFAANLVTIPNRGSKTQKDLFLNGVPYTQTINDVTAGQPVGIHFEPGIWLVVPQEDAPKEPVTVARMASIPHGTTIIAQGLMMPATNDKPTIPFVDITPLLNGAPIKFQNQTLANKGTRRIPQDLTALNAAGRITPTLMENPNQLLLDQLKNQTVTETVEVRISTHPATPLPNGPLKAGDIAAPAFGGGTSNIAFLQGEANPPVGGPNSNANSAQMDAIFWIETVVYDIDVPAMPEGTPPVVLDPVQKGTVPLTPTFLAAIPFVPGKSFKGCKIRMATTQIQYSQKVMLDFAGLRWPHVSVASLVPAAPIPIPESLLPLS